jgi:hypothetical protein
MHLDVFTSHKGSSCGFVAVHSVDGEQPVRFGNSEDNVFQFVLCKSAGSFEGIKGWDVTKLCW